MPLTPETRLGPYQIIAPLGAGGMGEVYRARDTKLGRDVALKVLPAELSSNAPCLLYCNSDAVLSREVERFRQVYEDARIEKLCGPRWVGVPLITAPLRVRPAGSAPLSSV